MHLLKQIKTLPLFFVAFLLIAMAQGQQINNNLKELKKINVVEKLGDKIPLNVPVITSRGDTVSLSTYFNNGKSTVFVFAYYECPMLCTQVLNGLAESANKLNWQAKDRYQFLTLSINPREDATLAEKKRETYIAQVKDSTLKGQWEFLTATQSAIDTLTRAMGFEYYYIPEKDQYAHPAVAYVISPKGVISRYLYGLKYEPKNLKLALLEASQGKIGTTLDRILLYCYHYDPNASSYVLFANNLMNIGAMLTLFILILFIARLMYKNRKRKLKIS